MTSRRDPFVLGLDFGGTKIALATRRPDGERLGELRIPTEADAGAQTVLARALAAGHDLVTRTRQAVGGRLAAVAASTPGVVRDHGVLLAPNNPGWDRLPLRARLALGFGDVPVAVVNDVRSAALAESATGALAGAASGVYVNLGTGLSVAVVVGGTVLEGAHGAAGEIAYQVDDAPGGPCFTDGRAPLEERVSGEGIAARGRAATGRPTTTAQALAGAAAGDPALAAVVADALDALTARIVNLAVVLDPERVVLGGGLAVRWQGLAEALADRLRRCVPFPPDVVPARYDADAALEGALVLAAASYRAARGGTA